MLLLLSTHSHVPACGPHASFSVHLASTAVTPAVSFHKSRGDNVVGAVEDMMCVVCVDVAEGAWRSDSESILNGTINAN